MKPKRAGGRSFNPARAVKMAFCVMAGTLWFAGTSFGQNVFAAEINRPGARFGTINLFDGTFTQTGTLGGNTYNDIAQANNGTLFSIRNGQRLVTLDLTTGATITSRNFNIAGLQSLAI